MDYVQHLALVSKVAPWRTTDAVKYVMQLNTFFMWRCDPTRVMAFFYVALRPNADHGLFLRGAATQRGSWPFFTWRCDPTRVMAFFYVALRSNAGHGLFLRGAANQRGSWPPHS